MYTIEGVDFCQNSMSIRFDKLTATLGDVSLVLNFNDGETKSYDIGSISFTDIEDASSTVDNSGALWYHIHDKLHSRSIFGGSNGIRLRLGDDRALTRRT